jgi:hypothetical protein
MTGFSAKGFSDDDTAIIRNANVTDSLLVTVGAGTDRVTMTGCIARNGIEISGQTGRKIFNNDILTSNKRKPRLAFPPSAQIVILPR